MTTEKFKKPSNTLVFIPAAGTGSRLENLTKHVNKSMVTLRNKPLIAHIIDKFNISQTNFVIAIGFKGKLLKNYIKIAYAKNLNKFKFVNVHPYEGKGSSLGFTMIQSKKYLKKPFYFIACDSYFEKIPKDKDDFMCFSELPNQPSYRTVTLNSNKKYVNKINNKKNFHEKNEYIYTGVSYIKNTNLFWRGMSKNNLMYGEISGLLNILKNTRVKAKKINWHDCGNIDQLNILRKNLKKESDPNILDKENEAIWFQNNHVIKFSNDKLFIKNRVQRSRYLKGFVPKITAYSDNFYSYKKIDGEVFSRIANLSLFKKLLNHSSKFWIKTKSDNINLKSKCFHFYKTKTEERVNLFHKKFKVKDKQYKVNGKKIQKLSTMLKQIDWENLSSGYFGSYHGDFHFENIIFSNKKNKFIFLDWRQDFGGDLKNGDIYYDYAKLMHGLIINHKIIDDDKFFITMKGSNVKYDFHRKQSLVDCEKYFIRWLDYNNFDSKKVLLLTGLIYLNIAPLHHYPYSNLLYFLGVKMVDDHINN